MSMKEELVALKEKLSGLKERIEADDQEAINEGVTLQKEIETKINIGFERGKNEV